MNYYCLISGLPDIQVDDTKGIVSLNEFVEELREQLTASDTKLLQLLLSYYDNRNLLAYLKNRDANLNTLGNLDVLDWEELIQLMREFDLPKDSRLLPYVHVFYTNINDDKFELEGISEEDYLAGLYYDFAINVKNEFLQKWFSFNLNVNNLLTAVNCRNHGYDQRTLILGNNEISKLLRQSNARDFGLTGIFDELDLVLRISEETNLLERERKIDALKWSWLEENTFFHYFGVEKVLAYVIKLEMIERWKYLTVENGAQIFRALLEELKKGVSFED